MPPPPEVLDALDLSDVVVSDGGGATGRLWKITTDEGDFALRLVLSEESAAAQLAAMRAAAAGGIPVPEPIRTAATPAGIALLLSWLPGAMVTQVVFAHPDRARGLGLACGSMHRRLHAVSAPAEVSGRTHWAAPPFDPLPAGGTLLHLDFHPNNVLVDASGRVSAVLDWENAIGGDPLLDLARTRSIMTLDPAIAALSPRERAAADEFTAGWAEGYGSVDIPVRYELWAARVMLRDIGHRHGAEALAPLRARIGALAYDAAGI